MFELWLIHTHTQGDRHTVSKQRRQGQQRARKGSTGTAEQCWQIQERNSLRSECPICIIAFMTAKTTDSISSLWPTLQPSIPPSPQPPMPLSFCPSRCWACIDSRWKICVETWEENRGVHGYGWHGNRHTKNVARNHRSKWKVRACMCFMSQPQV